MAEERSKRLEVSDWPADSPGLTRPEAVRDEVDGGRVEQTPHPRLGAALAVLVLLGVLGALYWATLRDLVWQWWDDPNYSHGFLVPLFSGFLIWLRRDELRKLAAQGSWIGAPVLLAGVGALLLGDVAGENFLMRSSLIVVLAGLILFHLGREIFRVLAFPLLFLFFMIPLPATLFSAI